MGNSRLSKGGKAFLCWGRMASSTDLFLFVLGSRYSKSDMNLYSPAKALLKGWLVNDTCRQLACGWGRKDILERRPRHQDPLNTWRNHGSSVSCFDNNNWAGKEEGFWVDVGREEIDFQWDLASFLCYKMEEPGSKREVSADEKVRVMSFSSLYCLLLYFSPKSQLRYI